MKQAITIALTLAFALLVTAPLAVHAQQIHKPARIGFLASNVLSKNAAQTKAFREGLRALGYVEGKNIVIEWRSAAGKYNRLPALAAELARLKVAVIVTAGARATRPAKAATSVVPIVMASDNDPVGSGTVASLARPGGNITGLARLAPENKRKTNSAFKGNHS